jgi:anti-sigma regulatory factor (Ser/Thr protein kinase)
MEGTIVDDIVLAPQSAGNVIRHAYRGAPGLLEVAMTIEAERVELTARDEGTWRESNRPGRRGLEIMRRVMDTVDVDTGKAGTTVTMTRGR